MRHAAIFALAAICGLAGIVCGQFDPYAETRRQMQIAAQIMQWQLEHPAAAPEAQPDLEWELRYLQFCGLLVKYEKSRQVGAPDARVWRKLRKAGQEMFK